MAKPIHTAEERCYDYDDIYAQLEVEIDSDGTTNQTAYFDHADGEASDAQIAYALRAIECNDTGVDCE